MRTDDPGEVAQNLVVGEIDSAASCTSTTMPPELFECLFGRYTDSTHASILGRRIDRVLETTLTFQPTQFEVATGDVRLSGTIVDADFLPQPGECTDSSLSALGGGEGRGEVGDSRALAQ